MLLLVLMDLCALVKSEDSIVAHIDSRLDTNVKCHCMDHLTPTIYCQSIEEAWNCIKNKSNVQVFVDSDVTLKQPLKFEEVHNISVQGTSIDNWESLKTLKCVGFAGLLVKNVTDFSVKGLSIVNCKCNNCLEKYNAGVVFMFSVNVALENVEVAMSDFTGVLLLDCDGKNTMKRTNFTLNVYKNISCTRTKAFLNTSKKVYYKKGHSEAGGGLTVVMTENLSSSVLLVEECWFVNNTAKWGGGLSIVFDDRVSNNSVIINNTHFVGNEACKEGGGLRMNLKMFVAEAASNVMWIENTNFVANTAKYGGGVGIISSYSTQMFQDKSNIIFKNCSWTLNTALVMSPAVDITSSAPFNSQKSGFLPTPYFHDIQVHNNSVKVYHTLKKYSNHNDGVFVLTNMKVFFSGRCTFWGNSPSALKAVSGGFVLESFSTLEFRDNEGSNGAAISLYGFSYLRIYNHTLVSFYNNTARNKGGAVFYSSIDQHEFFTGNYCFLEREDIYPLNVTLLFDGKNQAEYGRWIYADSVLGCASKCNSNKNRTFHSIFKCVGEFKFQNGTKFIPNINLIRTSARSFVFHDANKMYSVVPGGKVLVNYTLLDDFNVSTNPLTYVSLPMHSLISFQHIYTLSNYYYPLGQPNETDIVEVTVDGIRSIHFQFSLHTLQCPPGFVYFEKFRSCECGNSKSTGYYYGAILRCNSSTNQALMDKQYWAGYIPEGSTNYKDLYFVPCYAPICRLDEIYLGNSNSNLSATVCGEARAGIMCGKCLKNYTVFYHSNSYKCYKEKYCHYGPLFYLLSELLPVLVVFGIVVMFDFTFTSGEMVGFIFFCQFPDDTRVHTSSAILSYVQIPYRLFYGSFKLDFFSIETFSFCLWKHFHIQEIILVKYVTISFAFLLVIFQILTLRSGYFSRICRIREKFGKKRSFIHGICAFLVICFIQCTKTSFFLLKHARPEGLNGTQGELYTYYGGLPFFQGKHVVYTTLAVFFLFTITVLPLLILLLHPFVLQILSLCHLGEHRVVEFILRVLCIHKLMPFFDSFQSCYKDRYRMFAGLYLVYRVALLLSFITPKSYMTILVSFQLLFLSFLGIHSVFQPYKNRSHNVMDSLIFMNLSVINMLSIMAEMENILEYRHKEDFVLLVAWIQTVLFYLPMVVFLILSLRRVLQYFRGQKTEEEEPLLEENSSRIIESMEQDLNSSVCRENVHYYSHQ